MRLSVLSDVRSSGGLRGASPFGGQSMEGRDPREPASTPTLRMATPVAAIAKGSSVYTGSTVHAHEYDHYARLVEWGYDHETVCHAAGEYARDDGDGSCESKSTRSKGSRRRCVRGFAPPGGSPGEPAAVPGLLRVRVHRPGAREKTVGCLDRPILGPTLQSVTSDLEFSCIEPCTMLSSISGPAGSGHFTSRRALDPG